VSFTVTDVAKEFGVENSEVTWVSICSRSQLVFARNCKSEGNPLTDSNP
jgi:SHS family lactate transporter-like MFS transporter